MGQIGGRTAFGQTEDGIHKIRHLLVGELAEGNYSSNSGQFCPVKDSEGLYRESVRDSSSSNMVNSTGRGREGHTEWICLFILLIIPGRHGVCTLSR